MYPEEGQTKTFKDFNFGSSNNCGPRSIVYDGAAHTGSTLNIQMGETFTTITFTTDHTFGSDLQLDYPVSLQIHNAQGDVVYTSPI